MVPGQVWAHNFAASRLGSFCAQLSGSRLPLVGRDLGPEMPISVQLVIPPHPRRHFLLGDHILFLILNTVGV